jgi:hypothetical protein
VAPRGFRLVVNEAEAERVRAIFKLYLQHESLLAVVQELERLGWVNKRCQTRKAGERGGKAFTRTSLYKLLTNVAYTGKVRYKEEIHDGEHAAIVDPVIWQRVQAMLERNGRTGGAPVRNKFAALLKGIIRCVPCDCAMTPSHSTHAGSIRYRYYVCSSAQKKGWHTCPSKSIPAAQIEDLVVRQIKTIGQDPLVLNKLLETGPKPYRPPESGRVPRVARLMALAIRCEGLIRDGVIENYTEIGRLGHVTRARVSQIMNLLNLAPDIQEEVLFLPRTEKGRAPIILAQLQPIAQVPDWRKQRVLWRELLRDAGT